MGNAYLQIALFIHYFANLFITNITLGKNACSAASLEESPEFQGRISDHVPEECSYPLEWGL